MSQAWSQSQMRLVCLPLAIVLIVSSVVADELTIDHILGTRFPSEPVVSHSGNGFAWAINEQGVRNIWLAQSPDFEARQVTNYKLDDGMELTDLQWCLDDAAIVYVRGGAPNSNGELPNPLSIASGVDRELWRIDLSGKPPVRIGKGHSPLIHPDGRRLAYLDEKVVKLVDLTAVEQGDGPQAETIIHVQRRSFSTEDQDDRCCWVGITRATTTTPMGSISIWHRKATLSCR